MKNINRLFKTIKNFFKKSTHVQAKEKYKTATVNVAALTIAVKAVKAKPNKLDKLKYILQHTKKYRIKKKLRKRIKKLS